MHFVIDQNFPWAAVPLPWPDILKLSRLLDVDPTLVSEHEDWEIFEVLAARGDTDGFVTNDAHILDSPVEMAVLQRTALTLVVTDGVGHEPLRATGLAMVYLPAIAKAHLPGPIIYKLRPAALGHERAAKRLERISEHSNIALAVLEAAAHEKVGAKRWASLGRLKV